MISPPNLITVLWRNESPTQNDAGIKSHPINLGYSTRSTVSAALKDLRGNPVGCAGAIRSFPQHALLLPMSQRMLTPKEAEDVIGFALRYLLRDLLQVALKFSPWRVNSINSSIFHVMLRNPYHYYPTRERGVMNGLQKWRNRTLDYQDFFQTHNILPNELFETLIVLSRTCSTREVFDQPFNVCIDQVHEIMTKLRVYSIPHQRFRDKFMDIFNKRGGQAFALLH